MSVTHTPQLCRSLPLIPCQALGTLPPFARATPSPTVRRLADTRRGGRLSSSRSPRPAPAPSRSDLAPASLAAAVHRLLPRRPRRRARRLSRASSPAAIVLPVLLAARDDSFQWASAKGRREPTPRHAHGEHTQPTRLLRRTPQDAPAYPEVRDPTSWWLLPNPCQGDLSSRLGPSLRSRSLQSPPAGRLGLLVRPEVARAESLCGSHMVHAAAPLSQGAK